MLKVTDKEKMLKADREKRIIIYRRTNKYKMIADSRLLEKCKAEESKVTSLKYWNENCQFQINTQKQYLSKMKEK